MSIEGLIASLVIVLLSLAYVLVPLLRRKRVVVNANDPVIRQRDRLEVYYDRVLRNLHDLDEDFATGKLNDYEYQQDRELWVERGVWTLHKLEELDSTHLVAPADADDVSIDEAIDAAIEEAVHDYRYNNATEVSNVEA